jgi:hypothetical protein
MKYVFTPVLFFCVLQVTAQHKKFFFGNIYFSGMAGNQVYETALPQWKNLYADRKNFPYLLDTMKTSFIPKDGPLLRINAKGALSLAAGKSLLPNAHGWMHNKMLEWRMGLFFKSTIHEPYTGYVTTTDYPVDTTKTHTVTNVFLQQKKQLLELQQLINFKTGPFLFDKLRMNIGSGIGISRTVKNTIHEKYNQTIFTWSSSQHSFIQQNTPVAENDYKAKPETLFSYIFYLGTELKMSKQMSFLSDFHYSIAHYKYNNLSPKTESYWLGLTFCYGLN